MVLNSANFLSWEDVIEFLRNILFDFGPKLIIAGLILYIGFRIIKFLTKKLNNIFTICRRSRPGLSRQSGPSRRGPESASRKS